MCNVIHVYILILNFFHLIWKIYYSIGRNLILKYCSRIIFFIKNNPPERILWGIKSNVTYQPCADGVSGILNIALGEKTREEYSEITDETSGVGMLLFGNPNI